MKIECYLSERCASEAALRENVHKALALEGAGAEVVLRRISDKEAESMGLRGSPSVLVNGEDLEPADVSGFA